MPGRLHFDCFSGISGDMTLAALLDLGVPREVMEEALTSLELPGKLVVQSVKRAGLAATQVIVETPQEHSHRHLSQIVKIIQRGRMSDSAKELAIAMFTRLAKAEAECHGTTIEKVHFHEVGAVDSIFDMVGSAVGIDWLKPDRITCSHVPTGSGWVDCEHGRMPVPAPAVARLLVDVPIRASGIEMELTTPTGAAIVATVASEFLAEPAMLIGKIGIGAGSKDLHKQPNVLRLLHGRDIEQENESTRDVVWQVETNIDDASPEVVGYCFERLFAAGALDVFVQPLLMKKNRQGTLVSVLCEEVKLAVVEQILFEETGTFGVRRHRVQRSILNRRVVSVETPWGVVAGKFDWNEGAGVFSPEYDDCAKVAQQAGVPLRIVHDAARQAFDRSSIPDHLRAESAESGK